MTRPLILVVGSTGKLGGLITRELLQRNKTDLRLLVRKGSEEKAAQFVQQGAQSITGDLVTSTVEELQKACEGVSIVISAIIGGPDITVEGQKKLAQAAENAGVKLFIPSDFSADFHKCDYGDNVNFDQRKKLAEYLSQMKLNTVSVLEGGFYEIINGFFSAKNHTVPYYGSPDQPLQFTTYEDTAKMVAEMVESNETVTGKYGFAGAEVTATQLKELLEKVSGEQWQLVNKGSVSDYYKEIQSIKEKSPNNIYSYLYEQYKYTMFSGKGYIDNKHQPKTFKFTELEDYIKANITKFR
jgi:uncharacterized protein YbjT (DUF2867 family)